MIAHVTGSVSAIAPDGAVIDVSGVGLLVQCTPATLARLRLGEQAQLKSVIEQQRHVGAERTVPVLDPDAAPAHPDQIGRAHV